MNTAKKSLIRTILIIVCLVTLGAFFQTGRSAPMFSEEPLPTVQVALRLGVEWMTIRNLPVEASTIWQENGQVFAISRPIINSAQDAVLYQELLQSRLGLLPDEQVLKAEVTFKAPLTLAGIESLLGQYTVLSLLAGGDDGSTGRVSYPPEEVPAEVQEGFSQVYEAFVIFRPKRYHQFSPKPYHPYAAKVYHPADREAPQIQVSSRQKRRRGSCRTGAKNLWTYEKF